MVRNRSGRSHGGRGDRGGLLSLGRPVSEVTMMEQSNFIGKFSVCQGDVELGPKLLDLSAGKFLFRFVALFTFFFKFL